MSAVLSVVGMALIFGFGGWALLRWWDRRDDRRGL
jgi:hypothetical protein